MRTSQEDALEAGLPLDAVVPAQGPMPDQAASMVPPSLDFPPSLNAHLLKMSAMGSNDPALRIMEIRPGWSTYMLQKMSLELKLQEAKLTEAIGSNSSDIVALEKKYFSLLKEYYDTAKTIESLEKRPSLASTPNMEYFVDQIQHGIRDHMSAKGVEDLNSSTRWVTRYDLKPNQVWARTFIHLASRKLGPLVQKIFQGESHGAGVVGTISRYPADRLESLVSGLGYCVLGGWFCVPVSVLALVEPPMYVAVVLLFLFVFSAGVFMSLVYPDSGHAAVFTIGYAAILSTIIFR